MSEFVFPISSTSTHDLCVFRYDHGPVRVKAPRRRGRPGGSSGKANANESRRHLKGDSDDGSYHFIHMGYMSSSSYPNKLSAETRATIRQKVMENYNQRRRKRMNEKRKGALNLAQNIDGVDPFDVFPVKLEPYMLDLLNYYATTVWRTYYTLESYTLANPVTDYWLPMAFHDSALLHTFIGCADSHADRIGYPRKVPIWLKHLIKAIAMIKSRIESVQSVTDSTITVVATFAFVEKRRGSLNDWRIHMNGLKKLVDVRGGLDNLESKPMVLNKIFRADLSGSIDTAQIPYFAYHYSPSPIQTIHEYPNTSTTRSPGFQTLCYVLSLDDKITTCINSLHEACQMLRTLMEGKGDSQAYAAQIRFQITNTEYKLLSFGRYSNPTHELCRMALLLLSESIVNESPPRIPTCDNLAEEFLDLWRSIDDSNDNNHRSRCDFSCTIPLDFRLWTMFVATSMVSLLNNSLMQLYLRSIADAAGMMGIDSWSQLVPVFERFLWESTFYGNRYLEIWSDARSVRR